jgi:hypothetical protein
MTAGQLIVNCNVAASSVGRAANKLSKTQDQLTPVKPQLGYFIEKQSCFCYAAGNKPTAYNLLCSSGVSIRKALLFLSTENMIRTSLFITAPNACFFDLFSVFFASNRRSCGKIQSLACKRGAPFRQPVFCPDKLSRLPHRRVYTQVGNQLLCIVKPVNIADLGCQGGCNPGPNARYGF